MFNFYGVYMFETLFIFLQAISKCQRIAHYSRIGEYDKVKGKHARDFHSLFLNFFCIFRSLIDTKRSPANIFENILQICTDIRSFRSLTVSPNSQSMAEPCCRKRGVILPVSS